VLGHANARVADGWSKLGSLLTLCLPWAMVGKPKAPLAPERMIGREHQREAVAHAEPKDAGPAGAVISSGTSRARRIQVAERLRPSILQIG
jgi:hypothetical protein